MSLFTQTSQTLDAVCSEWAALEGAIDEQIELLSDLSAQQGAIDGDVLAGLAESATPLHAELSGLDAKLQPMSSAVKKFAAKAAEGKANPDTALYGASMVAKIDAASSKLAALEAAYTPKKAAFDVAYAALQTRMAQAVQAAERRKAEDAERAAAEKARAEAAAQEAARLKAEQDKAAAAAAAEQAKQDELKASEEKKKAEEAAKAAAEARAAADRAAREQLLAERRATEATEAAARAAAAEQALKAKEAADAGKPLEVRAAESLSAALEELKANTTPGDLTIALQTLSKFVSNIMTSPMEEKYRTIRLSNEVLQKRLAAKPGGLAALRAMGFVSFQTGATPPPGSELKPNEEYYKIDAKPELWNVLVASKKKLDEAMAANRARDPNLAAASAAGAGAGAAGAGAGAPRPPAAASPFAGMFPPMFPPAAAGAGAAAAGLANPLANPMAMMSDPFVQSLMSSPNMMALAQQAAMSGGGPPTPAMQQGLMQELMSNPGLMQSMMSSPLVQGVLSDPARMAQMQAMRQQMASPFGAPFAGMPPPPPQQPAQPAAPAADPMSMWMNMMAAQRGAAGAGFGAAPPGAAAAAGAAPFSPFLQQPITALSTPPSAIAASAAHPPIATPPASAAAPAAAPAPAAAAAPAAEEEVDEEALLAEAIQMSMSDTPQPQPPADKK